jgi:hypothetical protein
VCWTDNPPLAPVIPGTPMVATGDRATHRIACHNPPTPAEAAHGHPERPGHVPAPAPAGQLDELVSLAALADGAITVAHLAESAAPDAALASEDAHIHGDDEHHAHGGDEPGDRA